MSDQSKLLQSILELLATGNDNTRITEGGLFDSVMHMHSEMQEFLVQALIDQKPGFESHSLKSNKGRIGVGVYFVAGPDELVKHLSDNFRRLVEEYALEHGLETQRVGPRK